MAEKEVIVILGNQLVPHHPALKKHPNARVLLIEADDLCRKFPYHKHKLLLLLASMREYAERLDRPVTYVPYEPGGSFAAILRTQLKKLAPEAVIWMHTSNKGPNRLLEKTASSLGCKTIVYRNAQFLTSVQEFGGWLDSTKSTAPRMETFYHWQRKRLGILMNCRQPEGDKWNFDHDNRRPLPKQTPSIPPLPHLQRSRIVNDIAALIDTHFPDNPGETETFWLPTTRRQALHWLGNFISERLADFGPYEDAMKADEPFLYHSVLSPLLNIGLLTPDECIKAALKAYDQGLVGLTSTEGFVRQIIGWREFIHGLYWWKADAFNNNHFGFKKQLEPWWYTLENIPSDLPEPVRVCLERTHHFGYSHHIERLMVLGNWFLLSGYDPTSVYKWFSSLYVDADEWVMIPNVMGMSQYADGGMLASKPYVSGGNYLQKMGRWWSSAHAAKESVMTKRYWEFIYDNRRAFANNPRMSLVVSQAKKHVKTD